MITGIHIAPIIIMLIFIFVTFKDQNSSLISRLSQFITFKVMGVDLVISSVAIFCLKLK